MFQVTVDTRDLNRFVSRTWPAFERQVPFALSLTLRDVAWDVQRDLVAEMNETFDRPTRWVTGLRVQAPKAKEVAAGYAVARVFAPTDGKGGIPPSQVLAPHLVGGGRPRRRSERASYWSPASGAPLDAHGNIGRREFKKLAGNLFQRGKVIFERKGKTAKPVMVLTGEPTYQPVLDWPGRAQAVVSAKFVPYLVANMDRAVATAKR